MKKTFLISHAVVILMFAGLNDVLGQWAVNGTNIYNTNTGFVGIGNSSPTTLLYVAKNMTEPNITVRNMGGSGGATFTMVDDASGANWKFKATSIGGFKIRDHAFGLDVIVIEPNSTANALYIKEGKIGMGTSSPTVKLDVRGDNPDWGASLLLGNSDLSHMLKFFPGRQSDPNARIQWKEGDPLRFGTDEGGWSEKMRISIDGSVGIGTETPASSALVEMASTSKGFLPPRMTQAQIGAISSPADGMIVYCTTNGKYYAFVATASTWKEILFGSGTITPFTCGSSFTDDRDNQAYNTVLIGSQCWMQSNLNYGTMLNGQEGQVPTDNQVVEKYCFINDPTYCAAYGGLYLWNEMMNYSSQQGAQGICPTGWHIPSDSEWCTLVTTVDPTINCLSAWSGTDGGGKMKEIGTTHWFPPNTGATNSSGFTGLGGGYVYVNFDFSSVGYDKNKDLGHWWTSSTTGTKHQLWLLNYQTATVGRWTHPSEYGFSLRCLKD